MGILETLISFSPWIRDKNWEVRDKQLVNLKKSGIHFRHLTEEMGFEKGAINILRGPRQIGKTTELKLMINDLLLKDVNPNAIFYLPCDNVLNRKDLSEHITTIIEYFQEQNIKKGYVFVDEITSIKDWQKTIKGLSDAGQLMNLSMLITGSSAREIKRGYERMPGRRGQGKDMVLLPMRYNEFCKCFGMNQELEFNLYQVVKDKSSFEKFKYTVIRQEKQFSRMLGLYFQYGGFPFVVAEIVRNNELQTEAEDIISSVMVSEIEKEKLNVSVLKSILLKNVSGWDEMSIQKGIGNGVLITRNCFEYGTVSKLPLWAFLLTRI